MKNTPNGRRRSFDMDFAKKHSVAAALIFEFIIFWIQENHVKGKNRKNGKTWVYQTLQQFHQHFPIYTIDQIKDALDLLVKNGVLVKDFHNKNKFNRTLWYALADESCLKDLQVFELKEGEGEINEEEGGFQNNFTKLENPKILDKTPEKPRNASKKVYEIGNSQNGHWESPKSHFAPAQNVIDISKKEIEKKTTTESLKETGASSPVLVVAASSSASSKAKAQEPLLSTPLVEVQNLFKEIGLQEGTMKLLYSKPKEELIAAKRWMQECKTTSTVDAQIVWYFKQPLDKRPIAKVSVVEENKKWAMKMEGEHPTTIAKLKAVIIACKNHAEVLIGTHGKTYSYDDKDFKKNMLMAIGA